MILNELRLDHPPAPSPRALGRIESFLSPLLSIVFPYIFIKLRLLSRIYQLVAFGRENWRESCAKLNYCRLKLIQHVRDVFYVIQVIVFYYAHFLY